MTKIIKLKLKEASFVVKNSDGCPGFRGACSKECLRKSFSGFQTY